MISEAATVDAYIAEVPPARRPALERFRAMIREVLPEAEEVILYGMPSYRQNGQLWVSFASQKNHIAVYGCRGLARAHADELGKLSAGKGCIRYAKPDHIDFEGWRVVFAELAQKVRSAAADA